MSHSRIAIITLMLLVATPALAEKHFLAGDGEKTGQEAVESLTEEIKDNRQNKISTVKDNKETNNRMPVDPEVPKKRTWKYWD